MAMTLELSHQPMRPIFIPWCAGTSRHQRLVRKCALQSTSMPALPGRHNLVGLPTATQICDGVLFQSNLLMKLAILVPMPIAKIKLSKLAAATATCTP